MRSRSFSINAGAPELLVLLHRDQLDVTRLEGRAVVVLDIIFATTTLIAALENGAVRAIPAPDAAAARAYADALPDGSCLLAGEYNAEVLDGFAHFAPQRLCAAGVRERTLVYATTNGTPSLIKAMPGRHVYAGALRNRAAMCRHLHTRHARDGIVLLCAGASGGFNLEDFYGAGAYVAGLSELAPGNWQPSDSARAALATFQACTTREALHGSRVGRLMQGLGLDTEIDYSAQLDVDACVAALRHGQLQRLA